MQNSLSFLFNGVFIKHNRTPIDLNDSEINIISNDINPDSKRATYQQINDFYLKTIVSV